MFLLVLIAHNIQNKNVEVWKSGEMNIAPQLNTLAV